MANMEQYIIGLLKDYYPTLDSGPGTPFYEYVVRPMAFLWTRHEEGEDEKMAAVTLADPENMNAEDLDRIMTRFFEYRKAGKPVLATARIVLKERRDYYIPKGTVVEASGGRIFITTADAYYSSLEIPGNPTDGYIIEINVESIGDGNAFNVYANETAKVSGTIADFVKLAYFPQDSTDGGLTENNTQFFNRVRSSATLKNLTTYRGVKGTLYENFNLLSVTPIGIRDSEMRRDLVELPSPTGSYTVHRGGMADVYVRVSPFTITPGYKAPLGFPYSYRGVSVEDRPTELMAQWNALDFGDIDIFMRGSVYETVTGLSSQTYMQSLTSAIGPIQDFVTDEDKEAIHSDNIVKQHWPLLVRATIRISDSRGTDAIPIAKQAFVDYVNNLASDDFPNVTDVGHALRKAGVTIVHTPMSLDCYYLNETLRMERIGLELFRYPVTSLLKPVESDSLKFTVEAESQISPRTTFFYTNIYLVNIEVV
jgi:hypothetical protein